MQAFYLHLAHLLHIFLPLFVSTFFLLALAIKILLQHDMIFEVFYRPECPTMFDVSNTKRIGPDQFILNCSGDDCTHELKREYDDRKWMDDNCSVIFTLDKFLFGMMPVRFLIPIAGTSFTLLLFIPLVNKMLNIGGKL